MEILRQPVRTAVLCGMLGLALYLAISWLAGVPGFGAALALTISVAIVLLAGSTVRYALRTGIFPVRIEPLPRAERPLGFWFMTIWTGLCAFAGAALVSLSGTQLMEVWLSSR